MNSWKWCFCQATTPSVAPNYLQPNLQVNAAKQPKLSCYPNPAQNRITLEVEGFEPGLIQVKLINVKGSLIRNDQRLLISGKESIVVYVMATPGIYFFLVGQHQKWVKQKIVIR